MAKNRRSQAASIRFAPALKALLLCLLIGGSGVGYVWQKKQLDELGQQMKKRELRLAEVREQNEKLRRHLAMMRSPAALEARAKELQLGLVLPQPAQVRRLVEPPARVLEIVGSSLEELAEARERFKAYKQQGFEIEHHNMQGKA